MIRVREVIVVEGRYDKNTLSQIVDADILETSGFAVFRDRAMTAYLRRVAEKRGVIILTDADGAGLVIRGYLRGILPPEQVKHAYIPEIAGKERRKSVPGKEGKLGVEGMRPEVLLEALRRAGATIEGETAQSRPAALTKTDLYELGLSGGRDSAGRRQMVLRLLALQGNLSANAMLQALTLLYTRQELEQLLRILSDERILEKNND